MGVFHTSLFVLALAFCQSICLTESSRLGCSSVVSSCTAQSDTALAGLRPTDLPLACNTLRQVRACIGSCIDSLMNDPKERAVIEVLEYVCDPENREQMIRVSQAACFHDGTSMILIESAGQECVQTMLRSSHTIQSSRPDTICPALRMGLSCVSERVGMICGEEVVPVFDHIFEIMAREMLSPMLPNCFDQVTASHQIVKRAIDALKKYTRK